jgi:hypothetical protein
VLAFKQLGEPHTRIQLLWQLHYFGLQDPAQYPARAILEIPVKDRRINYKLLCAVAPVILPDRFLLNAPSMPGCCG